MARSVRCLAASTTIDLLGRESTDQNMVEDVQALRRLEKQRHSYDLGGSPCRSGQRGLRPERSELEIQRSWSRMDVRASVGGGVRSDGVRAALACSPEPACRQRGARLRFPCRGRRTRAIQTRSRILGGPRQGLQRLSRPRARPALPFAAPTTRGGGVTPTLIWREPHHGTGLVERSRRGASDLSVFRPRITKETPMGGVRQRRGG